MESFNDWGGGGGTSIPSPGWSPKQSLPGIGLHGPQHGRQACPEFNIIHQGVGQIHPREGLFSRRPLPKQGQICYTARAKGGCHMPQADGSPQYHRTQGSVRRRGGYAHTFIWQENMITEHWSVYSTQFFGVFRMSRTTREANVRNILIGTRIFCSCVRNSVSLAHYSGKYHGGLVSSTPPHHHTIPPPLLGQSRGGPPTQFVLLVHRYYEMTGTSPYARKHPETAKRGMK